MEYLFQLAVAEHEEGHMFETLDKIGWQHDKETTWRFDCEIHLLVMQLTYQLMKMTELDDMLSQLIRKGQISRQEALDRVLNLQKHMNDIAKKNQFLLSRLGLSHQEIKKVVAYLHGDPTCRNSWQVSG